MSSISLSTNWQKINNQSRLKDSQTHQDSFEREEYNDKNKHDDILGQEYQQYAENYYKLKIKHQKNQDEEFKSLNTLVQNQHKNLNLSNNFDTIIQITSQIDSNNKKIEQKNQQSNKDKYKLWIFRLVLLLCILVFALYIQNKIMNENQNENTFNQSFPQKDIQNKEDQKNTISMNTNQKNKENKQQIQKLKQGQIQTKSKSSVQIQTIQNQSKQQQKQQKIPEQTQNNTINVVVNANVNGQQKTIQKVQAVQKIEKTKNVETKTDQSFYQKQIKNYYLQSHQTDVQKQLNQTLKFWMMTSKNIQENQELKKFAQTQKEYFEKKYQISKYGEIQICVVVLSYMNEANDRYKRNLDSIFQQQYENYKVYYVDDYSKDRTAELVETYIKSNKLEDKIKLYKNTQKKGKSYNQFYIGQENCKPGSVMVVVDGDDELIGRQVFKFLSAVYQQTQLYYIYTHSVVIYQQQKTISRGYSIPLDQQIIEATKYRSMYVPSHLRTWISDLFLDIKKEDLFIKGTFPQVAEDVGSSFQLMQKAGKKVAFIKQYIYRYVTETGYNDYQIDRIKQVEIDRYYRKLQKFDPYDKKITLNIKPLQQLQSKNYEIANKRNNL